MKDLLSRSWPILLMALAAPFTGWSQSVGGPGLGFLCDEASHGIAPLSGVAGAAWQGASMPLTYPLARCFVSPSSKLALTETGDGEGVSVVMLPDATRSNILEGVEKGADIVVFSPSGESALLYFRITGTAQVVSKLSTERTVRSFDLSTLPAPVTALAVDDSGSFMLAGTAQGTEGALFLIPSSSGALQLVSTGVVPGAVKFTGGSVDAVVADGLTGRITLIRDVAGAETQSVIAELGEPGITAISFSGDGKRAVVGSRETGAVSVVELATGRLQSLACGCRIGEIQRLAGNAVFLLGPSPSQLPIALDADGESPRTVFIPVLAGQPE